MNEFELINMLQIIIDNFANHNSQMQDLNNNLDAIRKSIDDIDVALSDINANIKQHHEKQDKRLNELNESLKENLTDISDAVNGIIID